MFSILQNSIDTFIFRYFATPYECSITCWVTIKIFSFNRYLNCRALLRPWPSPMRYLLLFSSDKIMRLASSCHFPTCCSVATEEAAVGLVLLNNQVGSSLVRLTFDHLYFEIVCWFYQFPISLSFAFTIEHHRISHIDVSSFRLVLHELSPTDCWDVFFLISLQTSPSYIFKSIHIFLSLFSLIKMLYLISYHVPVNYLCVSANYLAIRC